MDMCALKLISDSVPRVADKLFQRKYIALGRIVTHWEDIMGKELAEKTQPLKIHYRKARKKGDKPNAKLDIACSSANASLLIMKKGVLLEKMNQIFGDAWITDINFIHTTANRNVSKSIKAPKKPLNQSEKNTLTSMLNVVEDAEMKEKLARFGKAFYQNRS
ncbi:MAG: DciA family protein [Pseudomonadota bacterium]